MTDDGILLSTHQQANQIELFRIIDLILLSHGSVVAPLTLSPGRIRLAMKRCHPKNTSLFRFLSIHS
jgi:hypothetical protein